MKGFGRPNICMVPQRGYQYAIKRPLVNDRFFKMNKEVTSGLPFYVSQPLVDK